MKIIEQSNIIRSKRSNRDKKKEYCQKLKKESLISEVSANSARLISSVAGSANIFGIPVGTAMASPVATIAMAAYLKKFSGDLEYINQGCSSIPFDEIKEAVSVHSNRNFEAIEKNLAAINRNYNEIQLGFKKSQGEFNKINQELQKILQSVNQSKIKDVSSRLITFIEFFTQEQHIINHLPVDQLIAKLEGQGQGGILHHLKIDTTSVTKDSLHILLNQIINQKFAIPESPQDNVAFTALELLCFGTEIYTQVMFFLLQGHIYLANIYHQKSDVDAYNRHFKDFLNIFIDFQSFLMGINDQHGLIDKTAKVLEDVKKLNFYTNEKKAILTFLAEKISNLKQVKSKLTVINTLPQDKPSEKIRYHFLSTEIPTPIGAWQDRSKVSYAIQYKDKAIYSKVGDWSTPYTVLGKANPQLDIGTAPEKITRLIFRRFDGKDPELVGIVEDSNQRNFKDINRDLYNAASEPNEEIAKNKIDLYIKNGADIHALFEEGMQAIHVAAQAPAIETVLTLIKNGADINAKDINGYTPIHLAAKEGYENIITELISHGANINAKNNLNWTALHIASSQGYETTVKSLLQSTNIDINASANGGFTPLHLAVSSNNKNIIDVLSQDNRTNVNKKSEAGLTPLHLACINGNDAIAQILLSNSRVDIHAEASANFTGIHFSSLEGNLAITKLLIEKGVNVNIRSGDNSTPLILAASKGRLDVIKYLVEKGASLTAKTKEGLTAMNAAISMDHTDAIKFFIDQYFIKVKHADINSKHNEGITLLHFMAISGRLEVVKYLLEAKHADANIKNNDGDTPLHFAVISSRLEVVKYLLEAKHADANIKNNNGDTPLHFAAISGRLELVKYFIEDRKADINTTNNMGDTLLQCAVRKGHLEVVKYLIEDRNADINTTNNMGDTLLQFAVREGYLEVVKYLIEDRNADINTTNNKGEVLLQFAIREGSLEVLKYLIEERHADTKIADTNIIDSQLVSYLAAKYGLTEFLIKSSLILHFAISVDRLEVVKYLIEARNTDLNAVKVPNDKGDTFLHFAVEVGHLEVLKYFIEDRKADLNMTNNMGETPLHFAVRYDHLKIIKYLIEDRKADLNMTNNMGETPLHFAAKYSHLDVVKYFIEDKHADVNIKNKEGNTPLHFAARYGRLEVVKYFIEDKHADVNIKNKEGNTPLHFAAKYGRLEVVKYFIEDKHADVNIKDNNGNTPLHLAAVSSHLEVVKYLIEERHADVNSKENSGNTPLHFAVRRGSLAVVKYLAEDGNADINTKNNEGYTPSGDFLRQNNCHQTLKTKYLESKGAARNRRSAELEPLPKRIDTVPLTLFQAKTQSIGTHPLPPISYAAESQAETNENIAIGHGTYDVLRNDPHSRSHLVGNGGENVAKESNAQVHVIGSYYKDSRQSIEENAAHSAAIKQEKVNKSIWEMVLPIIAGAGTLFGAGMGLRYQMRNWLRSNVLPVVAAQQVAVVIPLLPLTKVETKSMNQEVALANTKVWGKALKMDGCILGARYGDEFVAGVTCVTKNDQMVIFPKYSDIKLEKPEDKFFKESCHPIEFNGRPSVYCEGEEGNMLYTPGIFEPPLERINGLLMLFQVGLHQGKKLYHWLLNSSSEKTSEALSPVVSITTEQKTIWIELLVGIETRLTYLNNVGKVEDELCWVRDILEDRKEEYKSLSQKTQTSLEEVTALTENLKALQVELEVMVAPVSTANRHSKKSDVRKEKEDVSNNLNPRAINTSLLSNSANQRVGCKSSINQRFFKEIHQPTATSLPVHAMNSTMINASAIQPQYIGGR